MKVMTYGSGQQGSNDPLYSKGFTAMGISSIFFAWDIPYNKYLNIFRSKFIRKVLNKLFWRIFSISIMAEFKKSIDANKPDLIFVLKGWHLKKKWILEIKRENPSVKIFCFNPDNPFNTWHSGISNMRVRSSIPAYDSYLIWSKRLIHEIEERGGRNVQYLPFMYDPEKFYPEEKLTVKIGSGGRDVAFIGSWDEERSFWLSKICDLNLKIWGNSWEKGASCLKKKWSGKPAFDQDFIAICSNYKIIINIIRKQNEGSHNMRTFEVPACGGFMLSTRTSEQQEFFEEGKEAAYFSTPEELREKVLYYLKNDELREKIARSGYEKLVKSGHTYVERAKRVIEIYNHSLSKATDQS